MTEKLTFEQSMERLEQIARTLEKGETGLEEAMELYAQAGKLIVSCQKKLTSAQLKIEKIDLPSLAGTKEADGPLGGLFDIVGKDDRFGQNTWEKAESSMQRDALTMALGKAHLDASDMDYVFAGDLLGQSMATTFGVENFRIPWFGVYGACSTCGESLSLAAAFVAAGYARHAVAVTSSHFGSAEKQFRFPNQYANQRPVSATWTVTGSAAFIVGSGAGGNETQTGCDNERTGCDNADSISKKVQIEGITTGVVVDYGIKDAMNMGAAMAPAACELIVNHLSDFGREASYYDRIVTGDLGSVGQKILIDLCRQNGVDISKNHEDCGMKMFDATNQNTGSGGSGCACSATVLSAYYLPKLRSGELKRILFVPTGALLSPVSFNEGESVPGIAHGVVLEAAI